MHPIAILFDTLTKTTVANKHGFTQKKRRTETLEHNVIILHPLTVTIMYSNIERSERVTKKQAYSKTYNISLSPNKQKAVENTCKYLRAAARTPIMGKVASGADNYAPVLLQALHHQADRNLGICIYTLTSS